MYSIHRRPSVVLIPAAEPFRVKHFRDKPIKIPKKTPSVESFNLSFEETLLVRKEGHVEEVHAERYPVESKDYHSLTFPVMPIFDMVECHRFKFRMLIIPKSCVWTAATACKLRNF